MEIYHALLWEEKTRYCRKFCWHPTPNESLQFLTTQETLKITYHPTHITSLTIVGFREIGGWV